MKNKLVLSAFADEYCDDFLTQCEAMKGFGIGYIELRGVNGKNVSALTDGEIKTVKKILSDTGMKISAIGSPIGKITLDGDFENHLDTAKRIYDYAEELNVKNIRIFSFYAPDGKNIADMKTEVFDKLGELVRAADGRNVTLCHENEAKIYGESPEKCREILEAFDGKIKAVFDMGNFVLDGYDPEKAYETLKPYIGYFHIKDALYAGAIVPAGKGEAKIKEILEKYENSAGKTTFMTLEPHLQTFSGLNALVGKAFENPYKYESQEAAFKDALENLRSIL